MSRFFCRSASPVRIPHSIPIERYAEPYSGARSGDILPVTEAEMARATGNIKVIAYARVRQHVEADSIAFDPLASDQQRQLQRAYYLANVTMIDEQVGRILERPWRSRACWRIPW